MQVHNYDVNGVYIASEEVTLDPIGHEPMVPAQATLEKLPEYTEGEIAVFDEISESWEVVDNHFGETWYTEFGEPIVFQLHGVDPIEKGLVAEMPLDVKNNKLYAEKIDEIQNEFSTVTNANIDYQGKPYQTEMTSFNDVLTALNSGILLPDGFTWRDADNNDNVVTVDDLKAIVAAVFVRNNNAYKTMWARKDALNAVDITSPTYETDIAGI